MSKQTSIARVVDHLIQRTQALSANEAIPLLRTQISAFKSEAATLDPLFRNRDETAAAIAAQVDLWQAEGSKLLALRVRRIAVGHHTTDLMDPGYLPHGEHTLTSLLVAFFGP